MTNFNPIATLLEIEPRSGVILINGREYDYCAAEGRLGGISEGIYRRNPGWGVSNPCFSLHMVPANHHKMALGGYLAARQGVKRAEAEAIVTHAFVDRLMRRSA